MSNRHQGIGAGSSSTLTLTFTQATLLLLLVVMSTSAAPITPYVKVLANLTGTTVLQAFYDSQGRIVYIDYAGIVRRVELNGTTATLATAVANYMAEGPSQELYFSLYDGNKIQKLDTALTLTDFAGSGGSGHGNGVGTAATFKSPNGIIYFALHEALYVSEDTAIRKIIVSTQLVSTVATNASYLTASMHLTITRNGTYIYAGAGWVARIEVATGVVKKLLDARAGNQTGKLETETIGFVQAYALSLNETQLMVGDVSNGMIRRLDFCTGYVDDAYWTGHFIRGFQQYCFNTTGECGVTFSGFSERNFKFFGFEDNKTSTDYSCPATPIPTLSLTFNTTATLSFTETPTPSPSPTANTTATLSFTETPTPSPSPTANTTATLSFTETPTPSLPLTPSPALSRSTSSSLSPSQPNTSLSESLIATKTIPVADVGSSSWGASTAVIAVVSVAAVGGIAAAGIAALKMKAAAAAASVSAPSAV